MRETIRENKEILRKYSYLAHSGVRGWLRPCMRASLLSSLKNVFTNEREYFGNVSVIFLCKEPLLPDIETCQIAYKPIIDNVGNKVKIVLVFSAGVSVVGFVDICFKRHYKFHKIDHIRFQFGNNGIQS